MSTVTATVVDVFTTPPQSPTQNDKMDVQESATITTSVSKAKTGPTTAQAPRKKSAPSFQVRRGRGKGQLVRSKRHLLKKSGRKLSKPAFRRVARRAGIKRIAKACFEKGKEVNREFMKQVLYAAAELATLAKRSTIMETDVLYALKKLGRPLYR